MSNDIHLYGQSAWHDDAYIVGNREGIHELILALKEALVHNQGKAEVFAGDGEGYSIAVHLVNPEEMPLMRMPYTDEMAADQRPDCTQPWKL